MKKVLFVGVFLGSLVSFSQTAFAQADTSVEQAKHVACVRNLVKGDYADADRSEELCSRFSQSTLGCAMDMLDMQMESDLFEAIEYCANPIVRKN